MQKAQGPFVHWRKQRKHWKEEFNRCKDEIERRQPLIAALQERKEKIEDKYDLTEARMSYGSDSSEYKTATEKATDQLQPVMEDIARVAGETARYQILQRKAERMFNIAQGHIKEMMDDPHIGRLLAPIELSSGGGSWRIPFMHGGHTRFRHSASSGL